MATISIFYGIIISMMYMDNKQHAIPHVHADYQGQSVVLSIPDGDILAGDFPVRKLKLVRDGLKFIKKTYWQTGN